MGEGCPVALQMAEGPRVGVAAGLGHRAGANTRVCLVAVVCERLRVVISKPWSLLLHSPHQ